MFDVFAITTRVVTDCVGPYICQVFCPAHKTPDSNVMYLHFRVQQTYLTFHKSRSKYKVKNYSYYLLF